MLSQQLKWGNEIYALHEPEVDCISKRNARVPYEFGCKVGVATILNEGIVVGMGSFAGNPYYVHILIEVLEQVTILTDQCPHLAVLHRAIRGHGVEATRVMISGTRHSLTPKLIADLRSRSAIEEQRQFK